MEIVDKIKTDQDKFKTNSKFLRAQHGSRFRKLISV